MIDLEIVYHAVDKILDVNESLLRSLVRLVTMILLLLLLMYHHFGFGFENYQNEIRLLPCISSSSSDDDIFGIEKKEEAREPVQLKIYGTPTLQKKLRK